MQKTANEYYCIIF